MKVKSLFNLSKEEDIQIQSATQQIGLAIVGNGNPTDPTTAPTIRVRFVSPSGGTRTIIDRTPIYELLEINASGEGCFRYVQPFVGPPIPAGQTDPNYQLVGLIDITPGGALDLGGDGYLSVDIESPRAMLSCDVFALDAPVLTKTYTRYDPTTVTGVTKDFSLVGVDSIAIRPELIDTISLQYSNRTVEYTAQELIMIGDSINDIISFNSSSGTVQAGMQRVLQLKTQDCNRMTITPKGEALFYLYLLKQVSI
jgi:hypothetical protein